MRGLRRSPLHLVLTVRQRREEAEEKALTSLLIEKRDAEMRMQQLRAAHDAALEERRMAFDKVLTGADVSDLEAQCVISRVAIDRHADELIAVGERWQQQSALYKEARCQREVISELIERKTVVQRIAAQRVEQRQSEDIYLCRVVRARDRIDQISASDERGQRRVGGVFLISPDCEGATC